MSISDLIRLAQNRLATLNSARATADRNGEPDRVAALDAEITETEATLETLRGLA
jgi:hypothetical protein